MRKLKVSKSLTINLKNELKMTQIWRDNLFRILERVHEIKIMNALAPSLVLIIPHDACFVCVTDAFIVLLL